MNLTETQKRILRWLVEEVRVGNLDEEEIWFAWTFNGTSLVGYKGNPRNIPEVKTTTLDALQSSGCLTCDRSRRYEYKCALTGKAYEAVDSNFVVVRNQQTGLENVSADGDINATITQHITNKLAEKIGIVAQSGSTVNIDNLNIAGYKIIEKQVNVEQSGKISDPWELVVHNAEPADGIVSIEPESSQRDFSQYDPAEYQIPEGSKIYLKMKLDKGNNLLLLHKGSSGAKYCVCPSYYAPETEIKDEITYFPSPKASKRTVQVSGKGCYEEFILILTNQDLGLNWMPLPNPNHQSKMRVLTNEDIQELLSKLEQLGKENWKALYTYYDII